MGEKSFRISQKEKQTHIRKQIIATVNMHKDLIYGMLIMHFTKDGAIVGINSRNWQLRMSTSNIRCRSSFQGNCCCKYNSVHYVYAAVHLFLVISVHVFFSVFELLCCLACYCRFLNVCEPLSSRFGYIWCSWLFNFASVASGILFYASTTLRDFYFCNSKEPCKLT